MVFVISCAWRVVYIEVMREPLIFVACSPCDMVYIEVMRKPVASVTSCPRFAEDPDSCDLFHGE